LRQRKKLVSCLRKCFGEHCKLSLQTLKGVCVCLWLILEVVKLKAEK
jgi:hypothetical protein